MPTFIDTGVRDAAKSLAVGKCFSAREYKNVSQLADSIS
jgi:hypothetical protein